MAGMRKLMEKLGTGEGKILNMGDVKVIYPQLVEAIKEILLEEGEFTLRGLCTLRLIEKDSYMSRNPKTGEPVRVPKRVHAKCNFSQKFKDELRQIVPD